MLASLGDAAEPFQAKGRSAARPSMHGRNGVTAPGIWSRRADTALQLQHVSPTRRSHIVDVDARSG